MGTTVVATPVPAVPDDSTLADIAPDTVCDGIGFSILAANMCGIQIIGKQEFNQSNFAKANNNAVDSIGNNQLEEAQRHLREALSMLLDENQMAVDGQCAFARLEAPLLSLQGIIHYRMGTTNDRVETCFRAAQCVDKEHKIDPLLSDPTLDAIWRILSDGNLSEETLCDF